MLKRLGSLTVLSLSLSLPAGLLEAVPASAAECGLVQNITSSCTQSQPQQSQPQSQPRQSQPQSQPAQQRGPGYIAEVGGGADHLLALVNNERTSRGLRPLAGRGDVDDIARPHTRAMASRRTIWHNDSYFTAATRSSLGAKGLGENVAMAGSVEVAHQALMDSPGHRANILNGRFDTVGLSVVHDERGYVYVTQNFVISDGKAKATVAKKGKAAKGKKATLAKGKGKGKGKVKARLGKGSRPKKVRRSR
ncbi:MAG: CAP domain-containing protein [Actinobacteria bacterium]|nr:CAP domain-containing protein [Actinomycetota bacterium]